MSLSLGKLNYNTLNKKASLGFVKLFANNMSLEDSFKRGFNQIVMRVLIALMKGTLTSGTKAN